MAFLSVYFRLKSRAYMGEVRIQVWLKYNPLRNELFDKQVNAQKEKNFRVRTSSHKPMKSVR